jgi:hypothetical protein
MNHPQLEKYLKFDDSDLAANRNGRLSPGQQKRLGGERSSFRLKARVVGMVIFLGVVLLVAFLEALPEPMPLWVLVFFLVPLGFAAFLLFGNFANQNYTISQVTGPIANASSKTYNSSGTENYHYKIAVGDRTFPVDRELLDILPEGAVYTVYYAGDWDEIISMEPLQNER